MTVLSITGACGVDDGRVETPVATLPSPTTLPLATTPTPLPLTSMPLPQTPTPSPATPTPPPLTPTPLLLTSTPLHPTPTPPAPTPDTVVATVEDLVFTDVTGTWKTDYGTMKLEQDGSAVTGTYTTDSGVIIDATISGRTLTGFWVEDASAANCGSAKDDRNFWGRISFEFDEDFTSFKGKWRWCEQDPTENWNGKRIPTPLATHFIAVADRGVGTSASPVFHYSLEYWQCGGDFSPLHHMPSFTPAQIVEKIYRAAKVKAAQEGKTLTRVVEEALREHLNPATPVKPFKLNVITMRGELLPGVNIDDRDSLYEIMEGRG